MPLNPDQFGDELTDQQKSYIDFERVHANSGPGTKESAIWKDFGHSGTRHAQMVNHLLDNPNALAHDPVTVNRLRAKRQKSRDARSNGYKGTWGGPGGR